MITCPKCGGGSISGPLYEPAQRGVHLRDRLRYRCLTCGYSETRPTRDQDKDWDWRENKQLPQEGKK